MAHGAAHIFGWEETPRVGYAALLFPSVSGRMRVLDQGVISDAPWPQPRQSRPGPNVIRPEPPPAQPCLFREEWTMTEPRPPPGRPTEPGGNPNPN